MKIMAKGKAKHLLLVLQFPPTTTTTHSTEPTAIRCLVLRGLPVILGDDTSMFFRSTLNLNDGDSLDIPVGILCYEDNRAASTVSPRLNPSRVGIICNDQPCNGFTHQPASSNVPLVWLYIPPGVPEVLEKHFYLHSAGEADLHSCKPVVPRPGPRDPQSCLFSDYRAGLVEQDWLEGGRDCGPWVPGLGATAVNKMVSC